MPRLPTRAVVFDAGHTLLAMDYTELTAYMRSRGHDINETAVIVAERLARAHLDVERATQPTRERTGAGRYVRYLLDNLGITDDAERSAVADWRRRFNVPIGLCHRADPEAAKALQRARHAGLVTGVISNSNGSVRLALEQAGLAANLDFVIDSSLVGLAKPDPRIFAFGLTAANVGPSETVYVGDSYFVDVVGARQAGLEAVLFDPGRLWGERDCPIAIGLCAAVELALRASC
jgi:FMN phosphatase YigB (HAD superfamily)